MATRPIFIPNTQYPFVKEVVLDFEWHAGFAKSQAQKSILSLHHAANKKGIEPVLEISTKSPTPLGEKLSAFNLMVQIRGHSNMSVECAFQGSKVFARGGPYVDLYTMSSWEAKKDDRLQNSGNIIGFNFLGEDFPTKPLTVFYDWIYLNALSQNQILAGQLLAYAGFSDIAFNPQKSINCQAKSAALFVALTKTGLIERILQDKKDYLTIMTGGHNNLPMTKVIQSQLELPFEGHDV